MRYIASTLNSADCASRGVISSYLLEYEMWFQGPPFLLRDCDWPQPVNTVTTEEELHEKLLTFHGICQPKHESLDIIAK